MNNDIVTRQKRLRLTREELHVILFVLDATLEDEIEPTLCRNMASAANKLRAAYQRVIAKENKQ